MKVFNSIILSSSMLAAASTVALADFTDGVPISITGSAGPQQPGNWGTGFGQGTHPLGGISNFWDSYWGTAYPVVVSSTINNINSLTLTVDFSGFEPGFYTNLWIDVLDLKQDGTIIGVTASQGVATLNPDGNGFHWDGLGSIDPQVVTFEITQSPTPGAAALMGMGGLAAFRRRRA